MTNLSPARLPEGTKAPSGGSERHEVRERGGRQTNVLVLGATGYVGARLCGLLQASGWAQPVAASSRVGAAALRVDVRDEASLVQALGQVQAVVNCVAGGADAIAEGARVLARAVARSDVRRVVHFSTMSVYGAAEGTVDEQAPLDASLGWYGKAKVEAEAALSALAGDGAAVTLLRPGCVFGPGSDQWVGRIGRWLAAGRLGDLGAAGDGWSNLVHVDDAGRAAIAALRSTQPGVRRYNLAAPDSPRWNEYFADLAMAIGATPLHRLRPQRLKLDALLLGPPLQVMRKVAGRLGRNPDALPEPITPGLVGLWQRQLRLDATLATRELGLQWTPYASAVQQCARWLVDHGQVEAVGLRRLRSA